MRIPELIVKASTMRRDPVGHVRSVRTLVSQRDDEEINDWCDVDMWRQLARSWQALDSSRTDEQAREHFQRVARALGLKEKKR